MSNKKSVIYEAFKRMAERDEGILLNPMDARPLEETDPKATIAGIPVYESPFTKPGEWGLIPKQKVMAKVTIDRSSWDAKFVKIEASLRLHVTQQLNNIWGFDPAYKPEPYHWQRYFNEALLKWVTRLFERGLLDDPEIRWAYQKTILSAPVKWWNKLFRRT